MGVLERTGVPGPLSVSSGSIIQSSVAGNRKRANRLVPCVWIGHKHVLLFTRASVYVSQTNVLKMSQSRNSRDAQGSMEDVLTAKANSRR